MKKITILLIILLFLVFPVYGVAITSETSIQEQCEDQSAQEQGIENERQKTQESSTEGKRVEIKQNAYYPVEIHVQPGTTVTWHNMDSVSHTVTSGIRTLGNIARLCYPWEQLVDNKLIMFDSGTLEPKWEYSITFKDPGEYPYFDRFHLNMEGKVIVSE